MKTPPLYYLEIAGVGTFQFRRRLLRDQIRIEAEALRITGGPVPDRALEQSAMAIATLQTLTVESPEGWSLDELDPLEVDAQEQLFRVYGGLRKEEERFRDPAPAGGPGAGQTDGADNGVRVPPPVSDPANG